MILPVLTTETIVFHSCKNMLTTESIRQLYSLSQINSIIYHYGSVESLNSRLTAILGSTESVDITGRDFGISSIFLKSSDISYIFKFIEFF